MSIKPIPALAIAALATFVVGPFSLFAAEAESGRLAIRIEDRGELSPGYALFARPSEVLRIHITSPQPNQGQAADAVAKEGEVRSCRIESTESFVAACDAGVIKAALSDGIAWEAPAQPGWLELVFQRKTQREIRFEQAETRAPASDAESPSASAAKAETLDSVDTAQASLSVGVLYPFDPDGDGSLEGSPIGVYPNPLSPDAPPVVGSHPDLYRAPRWFIRVTPETASLRISPHFRLGDFSPPSERGKPHFIALDPRLATFLEALCDKLNVDEGNPESIRILRAFLSPNGRARLEREGVHYPRYSRYQYGDAAGIIFDADGDGVMDDLDGDGEISWRDAEILADNCRAVQSDLKIFGGIGVARKRKDGIQPDTSYVDVDLRGIQKLW